MKSDQNSDRSRDERLAARLRENLKRRKAQARELDAGTAAGVDAGAGDKRLGVPGQSD